MRYASGGAFRQALEDRLRAQSRELGVPLLRLRNTHALPSCLPDAPASWAVPFAALARDVGLEDVSLAGAVERARDFLDPVLRGEAARRWDPNVRAWRTAAQRR